MAVRITCISGHALRVPDRHMGDRVRCPLCRDVVVVNRAAATPQIYACPSGHRFRVPVGVSGNCVACPTCERPVRVPVGSNISPAATDGVVRTAAKPVIRDVAGERLLPVAMLVGTAVATLIGIAWYARSAGLH